MATEWDWRVPGAEAFFDVSDFQPGRQRYRVNPRINSNRPESQPASDLALRHLWLNVG